MSLKKIFTSMAVAVISAMCLTIGVSAEGFPSKGYLCGEIGSTKVWKTTDVTMGSTIADVNGDAQYEAEWAITDGGASTIEYIALNIPGISTNVYSNLKVTIDKIIIDGVEQTGYTTSPNAINLNFTENGTTGTRVFLNNSWDQPNIVDVPSITPITRNIKVLFTIGGTGVVGTSNVTNATTPTEAPTNADGTPATTTTVTTTDANLISSTTAATTTVANVGGLLSGGNGAVFGNSTQTNSASTGDTGVAIATAGLVLTSGIATAAVMMRKKK